MQAMYACVHACRAGEELQVCERLGGRRCWERGSKGCLVLKQGPWKAMRFFGRFVCQTLALLMCMTAIGLGCAESACSQTVASLGLGDLGSTNTHFDIGASVKQWQ